MRFSGTPEDNEKEKIEKKIKDEGKVKKIILLFFNKKALLFVIIFLTLLFSPFIAGKIKENFFLTSSSNKISPEDYYAVFLDNNQVYFGKMTNKSTNEIKLANVYYLQSNTEASTDLGNQHFTLIKLGQELHGPTDEMMINTEHVVFFEKLRSNSKVVESIKNQ